MVWLYGDGSLFPPTEMPDLNKPLAAGLTKSNSSALVAT